MTIKPQVNRQAENEQGADATESKRKQVSKRLFLDASGNEADRIEQAAGARYTLLAPSGNINFDEQLGEPGKLQTMCAIMGYHTKLGNVANTVLNDKEDPGSPEDAAKEITAFLARVKSSDPVWTEKSEGPVGTRIDKDALAGAIVTVAEAAGKKPDYAAIRERLDTDPQYVRNARSVQAVANEYNTRVGKASKSIDDLL